MTPINLKIETLAQKKILQFLIEDRIRINDRALRVNRDPILTEYYTKQTTDLQNFLNQLK